MKPRIIHADSGTIDASKVLVISPVEKQHVELFTFAIISGADRASLKISSSDKGKLDEIRRRLIGFVWPNADVFDINKTNNERRSITQMLECHSKGQL